MFRTGEGLFDMTLLDRINDDSFMANLKERFQVRREIFFFYWCCSHFLWRRSLPVLGAPGGWKAGLVKRRCLVLAFVC